MNKDDGAVCDALVNWFESQGVKPVQAVGCLAQLLGVVIGQIAPSVGECIKGVVLAHETTLTTALNSLALKLKKG